MIRTHRSLAAIAISTGAATVMIFPAASSATTTVSYAATPDKISVVTTSGTANDITVTQQGNVYTFADSGDTINKSGTSICQVVTTTVVCTATVVDPVTLIDVNLGSESDSLDALDFDNPVSTDMDVSDAGTPADASSIYTGNGNDVVNTGGAPDTISTADGNDFVDAGDEADTVSGDEGNDELHGGTGANDDDLDGGPGDDMLDAGAGDDSSVYGDEGDDRLIGGTGDDFLDGGEGNDIFVADAGADDIAGGEDFEGDNDVDTMDYHLRSAVQNVSLDDEFNDGDATDESNIDPDFLPADNVESDVERVLGGSGGDTLTGSVDDDILEGNGGTDTINGDEGNDTADYTDASGAVTVDLSKNNVFQNTGVSTGSDKLIAMESVNGGPGADSLTGSTVSNAISGAGGADTIKIRDASSDSVDCGAAVDNVTADASDVTDANCENVDDGVVNPPSPPPSDGGATEQPSPPPATASDRSAPKVSIASKSIKMAKNGSIKVKINCPADESSCSGSANLGKSQMGTAIFSGVPGGGSKQLTIKLTSKAKKQVKKKKKLAAKLKITARDSSGNAATTEVALTIKK